MGNLLCKPCYKRRYQEDSEDSIDSVGGVGVNRRESSSEGSVIIQYDVNVSAGLTFSSSPLSWEIASEKSLTFNGNNVTNTVPNSD